MSSFLKNLCSYDLRLIYIFIQESFEIAEKPTNPDSFKILNIFPTREDLVKNGAKIKPNIINGAYISVEHYLDLQFKLLREDCFGPLRDGICW